MPRPVGPILVRPVFCSRPASIRLGYGRMTWAFSLTTSCAGSESRPRLLSRSISSSSASGSTTTPFPMKQRFPAWRTPLGPRCSPVFTPPQRVAGVRPALVAHHNVGPRGEEVDDLPLPLVTPLGADDHHVRHAVL